jgi:hypothetical protein
MKNIVVVDHIRRNLVMYVNNWVQSQLNKPKNMLGNCQNSIKIIILLNIFV